MQLMKYGAVAVQIQDLDGLISAQVQGAIDGPAARQVIGDAPLWAPLRLAHVVDYTRAAVQLSAAELFAAALAASPGDVPTAVVVTSDSWSIFSEYAALQATRGVLKAVFLTSEQANRWAADQARVRAFWLRARRALGSLP